MPILVAGVIAVVLFFGGISVFNKSPAPVSPISTPIVYETPSSTQEQAVSEIPTITPTPTLTPTPTIRPTITILSPSPTKTPPLPSATSAPLQVQQQSIYQCNCSKTCPQMASCEEAYYQLNQCGCSKRDGDSDGVPCEDICPGG